MRGILALKFCLGGLALAAILVAAPGATHAACGDGIRESNEECDPGGEKRCNGDPAGRLCTTGAQCSSGINCYYVATCCKFNCQFVGQGAACSDGNECSGPDLCNNVGECIGSDIDGGSCNDGSICTVNDTCSDGTCSGTVSVPAECDDGNTCTSDACDEETDACVYSVTGTVGSPCDDNNICTTGTTCNPSGGCSGGTPIDCTDGIDCTADTCHPITGCRNFPDQEGRDCADSCSDGFDNDGDAGIDFEDSGCATLAPVQRFAVLSSRERSRRGLFTGSDVSVAGVSADGICNPDDNRCDCDETAPLGCLALDRPCAGDADCVTAVAGTCDVLTDVCVCPAETPNCQALGRPCAGDEDCGIAPFPLGPSLAGVCGYSSDIRAGTDLGFFTSSGNVKFGKGATAERTLDMLREFATDGGAVAIRKTSAPLVGPTVCSSATEQVCSDDADCPFIVDVCTRGQCSGHAEACTTNADCAPACDYRRRVDDGFCGGDPSVSCITDAQCASFGGACVHPFVSTDGSSENMQLCNAAIAIDPSWTPDTSTLLLAINQAIADWEPAPGELVDVAAACEACPTPETPDGDPACIPCPDPSEIRTRKDFRKVTITVGGGLQVLDLRRIRLSGNTVLRINGQDDTVLVGRIDRNLRLGGLAQLTLGANGTGNGRLRVENTLWNVQNRSGGSPNFIRNALFQGTVLAPERSGIRVGADVRIEGALFSKKVHIGGPSTIVHVPFTALLPVAP